MPGDVFGVESGELHRFTAEAIVETKVWLTNRQNVVDEKHGLAVATNRILKLVTSNLQHAEIHTLLLGRKTSIEKVATFLIEMDLRLSSPSVLRLPMNRRDIADYLGLRLETVSRALSELRDRGIPTFIGQCQREIILLHRKKLAEFSC